METSVPARRRALRRQPTVALLLLIVLFLFPASAAAQHQDCPKLEPINVPSWANIRSILALNMLMGGISAGVVAELRGGSFTDALVNGAAGGAVVFLGKGIAARRFDGAGMLGRQVAAVGGAMVQNAAAGLRPLDRLAFPVGPVHLLVDTRDGDFAARLDPIAAAVVAVGAVHPRLDFDLRGSLDAGAPVFRAREGMLTSPWTRTESCALEMASVLFYGDLAVFDPATASSVRSHERVHVIQGDVYQAYWGRALLDRLIPDTPGWQKARPFLDVNLGEAMKTLTDALLFQAYSTRPSEVEAEALAMPRH